MAVKDTREIVGHRKTTGSLRTRKDRSSQRPFEVKERNKGRGRGGREGEKRSQADRDRRTETEKKRKSRLQAKQRNEQPNHATIKKNRRRKLY